MRLGSDTYLLEHLVDVGENRAVKMAVLIHGEEIPERSLGHLLDGVLDGNEFIRHILVVGGQVCKGCDDFSGVLVTAWHGQLSYVSRRLWNAYPSTATSEGFRGGSRQWPE